MSLEGVEAHADLVGLMEQDGLLLLEVLGKAEGELSVLLVDDARIAELNAEWRGVDGPTDVLSFPQGEGELLGDLVLSVDTAKRQGDARGHSLHTELRILMVHGLLHLMGYDHELDEEAHQVMAKRESELIVRLGWEGAGLIERVCRPS